jgi:hypothetical protein
VENFSSFPPEEEQHFVVFEERMKTAERSANRIGLGAALGFGVLLLTIVFAYWGQVKPILPPEEAAPPATERAVAPRAPAEQPAAPAPAAEGAAAEGTAPPEAPAAEGSQ